MNILIVGGAGYIGSMLLYRLIKDGHKVSVYDNLKYGQKSLSRVEYALGSNKDLNELFSLIPSIFEMDFKIKTKYNYFDLIVGNTFDNKLLESIFEKKFDFVFHFGELVGISICNRNQQFTENVNFVGTKNVVDLCDKYNSILIYNSTSSLYGYQENDKLVDENGEIQKPSDEYCKNKLKVEEYIKSKQNLKSVIFRPSTVGGLSFRMRMELLPHHFSYALLVNKKFTLSNSNHYRAIVHIDDLINGYLLVINNSSKIKDSHYNLYNIGNDNLNLTKIQFLNIIKSKLDSSQYDSRYEIASKKGTGDMRNLRISSAKFVKDFGYNPTNDFEKIVIPFIDLLKKNPCIFDSYEHLNEPTLWKGLLE